MKYKYPKRPKVKTMDILKWIKDNHINNIHVSNIAKQFNISYSDASIRLKYLHIWGYICFIDRKKKGYGGYMLTKLGRSFKERSD